jgi:hypothetical protein
MSHYLNTNNSISIENPLLMLYLVKKLDSRKKSLYNMKDYLNEIKTKEELFIQKKTIIKFLEDLTEDFQQSIFAIKALLTENKALSLSNDAKQKEIKKQIEENEILSTENNDLKKSQNINFNNENYYNEKQKFNHYISKTDGNLNNNKFDNNFKINDYNFQNDDNKIINSLRLNLNKRYRNNSSFSSNNSSSNDLLIKIMNNAENLNLLNQKLGKNVIRNLISPNCSKEFQDKVNKIINENEYKINLKVPIRIKNNIQAEINSPKSEKTRKNKSMYNNFYSNQKKILSHRNLNQDLNKKLFDNYTSPYGGYFEKPIFIGNQNNYLKTK